MTAELTDERLAELIERMPRMEGWQQEVVKCLRDYARLRLSLEGCMIVPVEPNQAMYAAGYVQANAVKGIVGMPDCGIVTDSMCRAIYRAMVSAAPETVLAASDGNPP